MAAVRAALRNVLRNKVWKKINGCAQKGLGAARAALARPLRGSSKRAP